MKCVMPNGVVMNVDGRTLRAFPPEERARRRAESCRRYSAANREKIALRLKAWRAANPAKVREQNRRNRERHKDTKDAATKRWKAKNYFRVRETHRRNVEMNRERVRASGRKHYANLVSNPEKKAKKFSLIKAWRKANPDRVKRYDRKNQKMNRVTSRRYANEYQKRQIQKLTSAYVGRYLRSQGKPASPKNIELCKQRLQLHRARSLLKLQASAVSLLNLSAT